jgi:lipopolysaccharide/colanic/teichoic acid biosynthesis glycosyltransferase
VPSRLLCGDSRSYRIVKRGIDVVLSGAGLILLSPVLCVIAALVRLMTRGPALFRHVRQGVGGEEFSCLKFRTMIAGAEAMQAELKSQNEVDGPQFKIGRDPRLTRLGAWLRRYNIDELPQLINVFRGEMSLVGPRPSPDDENQYCPGWRRARLSVRPGITGLWQVLRLRDNVHSDFQEWIYYDLEYVRHRSLWLDWQILLYTPIAVFASRRLGGFSKRLARRGICVHSARLAREEGAALHRGPSPKVDVPANGP